MIWINQAKQEGNIKVVYKNVAETKARNDVTNDTITDVAEYLWKHGRILESIEAI